MKNILLGLTMILMTGAALFWKEVWGVFAGMSVLESLSMIVQFILHVTVATIAGYVVFGLPEIVTPWLRMLRQKRRAVRRGRRVQALPARSAATQPKKLTVDQLLRVLAPTRTIKKESVAQQTDPPVDLHF